MMTRTTAAFIAGVLAVAAIAIGASFPIRHELRRSIIGGPFTLEDTGGKPVTQADLIGKPTALFFGFTRCPDVCPTTMVALTDAMTRMGDEADRLNVVFVTLDPRRDTPKVLRDYLSSFDPRIRAFTGTEDQVAVMARAYHVSYRRVPLADGDYTMDHSAAVLTFDRDGKFVGGAPVDGDDARVLKQLTALVEPATR